ncbi:GAF domain-containing protein [Cognatilysobacter tabacisoli]|uniref:GAF domain-containing protein n=1 Tax=Cognatilysobacter tabacisoli TaxID=2315424 RepID=UPI0013005AAD|nr:GAF domain-containing protein [Lysobacter tabacisoli]
MPNDQAIAQVHALLERGAVRDALIYLNGLSGHRFTSLYRFDDDTLRSVEFYDREHPDQPRPDDIPIAASYCVFVRDSHGVFHTPDALLDARLHDHPKRATVRAYCGVPLVDHAGRAYGSVCHFDVAPVPTSEDDIALLQVLAFELQALYGL